MLIRYIRSISHEWRFMQDKIKRRLMESSRHAAGPEAFHFSENASEDTTLMRTGR